MRALGKSYCISSTEKFLIMHQLAFRPYVNLVYSKMNMTNFPVTTRILSPCYRITTKALAKFLAYGANSHNNNFILYFLLDSNALLRVTNHLSINTLTSFKNDE